MSALFVSRNLSSELTFAGLESSFNLPMIAANLRSRPLRPEDVDAKLGFLDRGIVEGCERIMLPLAAEPSLRAAHVLLSLLAMAMKLYKSC